MDRPQAGPAAAGADLSAGWRLRAMTAEDLRAVERIERAQGDFGWRASTFEDCLRAGYSAWVVTDTIGVVLGFVIVAGAVDEAHLLNLAVDPAHRRRGLGRYLLGHALALARAMGAHRLLLEVRASNHPAQALYRAEGFRELGLRRGYYPAAAGREDAVVMVRELAP